MDVDLDELLSAQHGIAWEAPNPFWRLCILTCAAHPRDFTAAFLYHHALGDGNSGLAFHRSFYHALSRATSLTSKDDPVRAVVLSFSTPLLPSLESLHPLPVTRWHLLTVLFREKIWSSRDAGLWTGEKCSIPIGNSRIRHLAFSASTTTAFKPLCRKNGTTITAALQTLIAGLLFSELSETFTKLACSGALSARRFLSSECGVSDDTMGVYVQDMSETYTHTSFRQHSNTNANSEETHHVLARSEAQRSRRNIENTLSLNGANAGVNLLRYVGNFQQDLFLSKVGRERDLSFELSNLGLFRPFPFSQAPTPTDLPKLAMSGERVERWHADVKIGRMIFTQSAGVTGPAIQVSVVTGADGCLVLGFSWQEGVVEEQLVEEVVKGARAELGRLTGTN